MKPSNIVGSLVNACVIAIGAFLGIWLGAVAVTFIRMSFSAMAYVWGFE